MADQADRLRAKLERAVARRASAFTLEVNRELRTAPPLGTPVQDGNARANWIPSVGSPSMDVHDRAGGNAANSTGTARVVAYKLGEGDLFITNRTPYIRALNNGHSRQSPALFVEAAIERARTKIMGGGMASEGQSAQDVAGEAAGNLAGAYSPFGDDP